MAGAIGHLGTGQVTLWNGIVSGAILWLGFMATTVAINHPTSCLFDRAGSHLFESQALRRVLERPF